MTLREAIGDRPLPCLVFDARRGDVISVLRSCDRGNSYYMKPVFLEMGRPGLTAVRSAANLSYQHYIPAFEENDPLIVGDIGHVSAWVNSLTASAEPHCPCPIHIQAEHNIGCEYAAWKRKARGL